jgi:hypothetical protein
MSGRLDETTLEENIVLENNIYVVSIISRMTGTIKEIEKMDSTAAGAVIYRAKIESIVYIGSKNTQITLNDNWHLLFPQSINDIADKMKSKKGLYPEVNDEILIADYENINYSYIYYVKGLHKIFIYHRCLDSAKSINIGEKYYFISSGTRVKNNPVLYGNIELGLFPFNKNIESRIKKSLVKEID